MKGAFHNYHTMKELQNWFSPHFEILFLASYSKIEKKDSILWIGKKK